jgi:hypothetical protein
MAGISEDSNQPFGFHEVFKFLDYLSDCQRFKKDSVVWSKVGSNRRETNRCELGAFAGQQREMLTIFRTRDSLV